MAVASPIQTNFTAGEWSPELEGRVDLAKYYNALHRMENAIALKYGGARRRSGLRFKAEVKDSAKITRLRRFEFSVIQAYVLEFGDLYIRFYADEGRLEIAGVPVEIATPYAAADLFGLDFTQSDDVLTITHQNYAPRELTRLGSTSFQLAEIDFLDGPYQDENADAAKTLQPSATTGAGITITAAGHAPFVATDVGRLLRIKHATTWGYAKIVGFTSTAAVTADVKSAFGGITAESAWRLGLWSATTGYPANSTFYEQRLYFAGATNTPQRIDGSKSAAFNDFTPGVLDDDPVAYVIGSDQVNAIQWLSAGKTLICGTTGAIFELRGSAINDGITPTNIQAKRPPGAQYGSAPIAPVSAGSALLFVTRSRLKLRELSFSLDAESLVAPEITELAEHITGTGLVEIDYAAEPNSIVWAARADGTLIGLTYERAQSVSGWHRHPIAAGGAVESLAVIPAPSGDHDQLWCLVRRTVGGATKRYIELLEADFGANTVQTDAFFVDSGLTYSGAPATVISGLGHLEGEICQILSDGAVHPDQRVSGGTIALSAAATKVHVGLGYVTTLETMRWEAGARDGTAQGRKMRIFRATLRGLRTLGLKLGQGVDMLDTVPFRVFGDLMNAPPPLFTGDVRARLKGRWSREPRVAVVQDQPLPFEILAIIARVSTSVD